MTDLSNFRSDVKRQGLRSAAFPDSAPMRERRLVEWLIEYANPPPEPGLPDNRHEVARRVAGWLEDIHRFRTFPDRLATFTQRVFRGWAAEAKQVVTIPLFELERGRIRLVHAVESAPESGLLSYALLLLLDEPRSFLPDLDRCGVCGRFRLLQPRPGPGRRERGACGPAHKAVLRKANQVVRQRRCRDKPTKPRSKR